MSRSQIMRQKLYFPYHIRDWTPFQTLSAILGPLSAILDLAGGERVPPAPLGWYKSTFLGPSLTDANCHGDICQSNIYPGDMYPYQDYLSCY